VVSFVRVMIHLAVLVELRLVTDTQTDGHRDTGPYRASIASRSKNLSITFVGSYVWWDLQNWYIFDTSRLTAGLLELVQ